ncbi:MAG: hypothetical protein ACI8V2_002783 [Candidatus Latescibacterota bacterium]|jgi:hypothetical protein
MAVMFHKEVLIIMLMSLLFSPPNTSANNQEIIPPLAQIKQERPRLLLRPDTTPFAISLSQLRNAPKGTDYDTLLEQLQLQDNAAAQAMVWLLTGEEAAADSAIARILSYRVPDDYNTFHVHSRLTEFGLAYDWLYTYSGFTSEKKAEIRKHVLPVAWKGYQNANDHMFHNYVWMSAGGSAIWALATAGEDAEADKLFNAIRTRFNTGLFPAMHYLDGLPSEPLGYWFYYDFSPCMLTLLATQSAFEFDLAKQIQETQNDWITRHFLTMVHGVLPDLRFIPWGDMQSGPNGGATIQYAGLMDGVTWLLQSSQGAWMSQWLAEKRGIKRFYKWTAIFYMIYTRNIPQETQEPNLSYLSGNKQAGHFMARSSWEDDATIVTFRATDHYGDHNHHDQGSFMIYREGLLAVDPPIYKKVRGPQEPTAMHNTLLLDGMGQRDCRGQSFPTIEIFEEKRTGGPLLETGDILFHTERKDWAAVAGQFAQAYDTTKVSSCVRQLLFIRPATILIIDHLQAPQGQTLPSVDWLLQVPQEPEITQDGILASNEKNDLLLKSLNLDLKRNPPTIKPTEVQSYTVSLAYNDSRNGKKAVNELLLIHQIDIDSQAGESMTQTATQWQKGANYCDAKVNGQTFRFNLTHPYDVQLISE